jgi:hypothetical protein
MAGYLKLKNKRKKMDESLNLKFVSVKRETEKAYLIEFKKTLEVWLPKSMCKVLDKNTIEVPVWLAAKNNLEEYED